MKLSQVTTEIRAIFEAYWGTTTPYYYENVTFNSKGNDSFIYLKVVEADKNLVGIYGNSAKAGLKRSDGILYIDYFFKLGVDAVTVSQTVEGLISALSNQQLTDGETYEGIRTAIQKAGNRAYNFVRIKIELDYEDKE